MDFVITSHAAINDALLDLLEALDRRIFSKPLSKTEFSVHLEAKRNALIHIATVGGAPCGYKIGFEEAPTVFFSWSGGVLPDFRRNGVASSMMREQHRDAKSLGYSTVRTRTKNKYRDMLVLNIKSGFDVTGVYKHMDEAFHGIMLEKRLE